VGNGDYSTHGHYSWSTLIFSYPSLEKAVTCDGLFVDVWVTSEPVDQDVET
jgi:hypothetical protein